MNVISDLFNKAPQHIELAKKEIKETYLSDNRPWVIGYSGGKDSTVITQLIFESISELSPDLLDKKIYVISSDTLVETPLIINSIDLTLNRIEREAIRLKLPFETHKVSPQTNQSFWTNIIGRGYPSPNQQFRWCTDRLKIDPANQFVKEKVNSFGEVVMVLGVREDESTTRANVIESHKIEGNVLMKHSTLTNAFVYAPIRTFDVDDVWNYLLNNDSPWGDDNHELYRLYSDSNSGECPLVIDTTVKETAGSCGNSRFGCWVCTVVDEDKALNGFIHSGHDWLKPLLNFRNWLAGIRDDRDMRMKYRANGKVYYQQLKVVVENDTDCILIPKKGKREKQIIPLGEYTILKKHELNSYLIDNDINLAAGEDPKILIKDDDGNLYKLGLGPFTLNARKEILSRLLKLQKNIKHPDDENYELIKEEELKEIRKIWFENGDFDDSLPGIFKSIMGYDLDWEDNNSLSFDEEELLILEQLCKEEETDFNLMKKLLNIEKSHSGYKIRRGITEEISTALKQDYLHL